MGRTRGISYALQIISKAQGWDPNEIIGGEAYKSPEVHKSDTGPIPASFQSPENSIPHVGSQSAKDFQTPDVSREECRHTTGADPFPGMPGSR